MKEPIALSDYLYCSFVVSLPVWHIADTKPQLVLDVLLQDT